MIQLEPTARKKEELSSRKGRTDVSVNVHFKSIRKKRRSGHMSGKIREKEGERAGGT